MRILVTGSRRFDDAKTIRTALDTVASAAIEAGYARLIVVHGACPSGADAIADMWVRSWTATDLHVTAERHPADWNGRGKGAGFERNKAMVRAGADLVLAFLRDNSPGTTHCVERATEAGIPLRLWHYGEEGVFALGGTPELPSEVA